MEIENQCNNGRNDIGNDMQGESTEGDNQMEKNDNEEKQDDNENDEAQIEEEEEGDINFLFKFIKLY